MAKPQKQAVYLSCMSLFRGENAKLRKLKGIKKILLLKQNSPIIGSLKQSHSFEQICDVVKELLEQGIFESTIKAKLCFPNLFQISPDRTAQRAESEAEAARSEAEAIEEAISSDDEAMVVPEEAKAEEQGNIPRTGLRSQSNGRKDYPGSEVSNLIFYLKPTKQHNLQPPKVQHWLLNRFIRCIYHTELSIGSFALSRASSRKRVLTSAKPRSQSSYLRSGGIVPRAVSSRNG